jgi:uncharacterized pyridoxamine 5'-phosphate oxidase family protein
LEKSEIYDFIRGQTHGVLATVENGLRPEAALVEVAVTPDLEIIFDTLDVTRKCSNLRTNPHIAFVFAPHDPQTLQYEGIADEPSGEELSRLKEIYFSACPAGTHREGWPGLTYFRVKPRWIRLNFRKTEAISVFPFQPRLATPGRKRQGAGKYAKSAHYECKKEYFSASHVNLLLINHLAVVDGWMDTERVRSRSGIG